MRLEFTERHCKGFRFLCNECNSEKINVTHFINDNEVGFRIYCLDCGNSEML
jgi:transcription elongation factor Elf1